MMHTTQALYDNLTGTLLQINKQIDEVQKSVMVEGADADIAFKTTNRFGAFVLTDLLVAKARCLSAMANLKVAAQVPTGPRRPPAAGRKW